MIFLTYPQTWKLLGKLAFHSRTSLRNVALRRGAAERSLSTSIIQTTNGNTASATTAANFPRIP